MHIFILIGSILIAGILYAHGDKTPHWDDTIPHAKRIPHKHIYDENGKEKGIDYYDKKGKLDFQKHWYYRSDGTLERSEEYVLERDKVGLREYFRTDGTKEREEFNDLVTGKLNWRRYYRADGTLERNELLYKK